MRNLLSKYSIDIPTMGSWEATTIVCKTLEVCILLSTCESILLIVVVLVQVNLSKELIACWLHLKFVWERLVILDLLDQGVLRLSEWSISWGYLRLAVCVNVGNPEIEKVVLFLEFVFGYTPICLVWWLESKHDGT